MGSFLKAGKRKHTQEIAKKVKRDLAKFNETLMAMNHAYHELLSDDDLNEENFMEKLAAVSSWRFNEKQVEMLKTDLIYEREEENNDN